MRNMDAQPDPVMEAIRRLRDHVQWKPGKDYQHLIKRIALRHLPPGATVAEYNMLIRRVVQSPAAEVFVYRWHETDYPTVVDVVDGIRWLVMCSLDGVMETAFPPEDAETYLADTHFTRLGTLKELGI